MPCTVKTPAQLTMVSWGNISHCCEGEWGSKFSSDKNYLLSREIPFRDYEILVPATMLNETIIEEAGGYSYLAAVIGFIGELSISCCICLQILSG